MNKGLLFILSFSLVCQLHGQQLPPTINGKRYVITTNKLDAATLAKRKEAFLRNTGGIIQRGPTNSVVIINAQKKIPKAAIEPVVEAFAKDLKSKVVYSEAEYSFDVTTIREFIRSHGGGQGIVLVENQSLPLSMIALEDGWGIVNIAPLVCDAEENMKVSRVQKILVRVSTCLFGGVESSQKYSAMQPVFSVADLDAMPGYAVEPEILKQMTRHMQKIGAAQITPIQYIKACQEGWAPSPTNEYQKAIWERFHKAK